VITFLLLSVVLAVSLQLVFSRHFEYEESQQNILNMQRVQSGFENQFTILNYLVEEWADQVADWEIPDDSSEPNPEIEVMTNSLQQQGVDAWLLLDGNRKVWQQGTSVELSPELGTADQVLAALMTQNESLVFEEGLRRKHGVLIVGQTPWLVSIATISDVQNTGLAGSVLVLGQVFDEADIQILAEQVKFPIRVGLFAEDASDSDFQAALSFFQASDENIYLERFTDTNLAGYILLKDIHEAPALILRADQYRFVARNAALVMRSMLIALAAASLVFAVLFFGLIERTMLTRLLRLDNEVQSIAAQPEKGERVTVDRKDEITSVSSNINRMMDALEENQQERFDELSVLLDISQLFLEQKSLPEVQNDICELALQHFAAEVVWLGERSAEDKMIPIAAAGKPLEEIEAVTLFEHTLHQYLLKPVFEISSLDLYGNLEENEIFYAIVLPLNWGKKPQAFYLIKPEKPNLREQDQQFLASFGSLSELVLGNTKLLAEVKSSQASLQELSHRLVRVHEEERRNLARELHDEIGQYLTGLKLRFDRVEINGDGDQGEISGAQELLNELIRKVRKLSLDLRPSVLDDLGLLPALDWYFERYTQQTGIVVDFDPQLSDRQRFSNEIEISIYRIVQESLTNVARHAGVKSVLVELRTTGKQIELMIEDEGTGFEPENQKAGSSSGLTGMVERARLLQGEMEIISEPGMGTRVVAKLPFEEEGE
jgi:signal transduction histidine kinase